MKLIKLIGVAFLIGLTACGVIFLIFCFGNWNWNPEKWGESARSVYAIACFFVLSIALSVGLSLSEDLT